ncbi:GntR family transcriptional regulator [uncultured Sphaerochaeta sp.]|uniref:GntR family transcriptional regulator n=1 Tax=uncultured Sphaerochaeta sp. TaxID=886478 RepID=UPI002A0AA070|nr:GntR family transcriptional regulator [uncultured Sphaerochaeta sp.]
MPKCVQNSLADQVYTMLKEQILSGQLKGGMKIPEEQLAEQFGVSRTPIREAIRRLSEYGLITIKPRSHAIVSIITQKEANDIAKVRVSLEQLAIDSIDENAYAANVKDFSRYAADCQYALGIGDRATVFEQDSLFHLALIKASDNLALFNICERLDAKIQQLRIAQDLPEDELTYYLNQHSRIMNLLKNGEKEACKKLIYEHITHDLTSHMKEME